MTGMNARSRYNAKRKEQRMTGYETEADFLAARDAFHMAARAQRVCQNPDCPHPRRPWDAHHVVYEQELRRLGVPIWDPRNAMRLCKRCHHGHHHLHPMPQSAITNANIEYALEVLGAYYVDYFNRRYLPECPI
jgi:hypothetical protein